MTPALKDLTSVDFSSVVTTNLTGVESVTYTYDGNGTLSCVVKYNQSIENASMSITFTPPYSAAFFATPASTVYFNVDSENNLGLYYFSP